MDHFKFFFIIMFHDWWLEFDWTCYIYRCNFNSFLIFYFTVAFDTLSTLLAWYQLFLFEFTMVSYYFAIVQYFYLTFKVMKVLKNSN